MNGNSCAKCSIANCRECSSATKCSSCNTGYWLNSSGTCSVKDENCSNYTDGVGCYACYIGYELDANLNCKKIVCETPNCDLCKTPTYCARCADGWVKSTQGLCDVKQTTLQDEVANVYDSKLILQSS